MMVRLVSGLAIPFLSSLTLLAGTAACADEEVKPTFDKAWVLLHGGRMSRFMDEAIAQGQFQKLPPDIITVLYMHGCAGIHKPDMELIARAGFLAIGLRSNARKDWKPDCDVNTKQVGMNPRASSNRQAEIKYALGQLPKIKGINMNKLVIMGHSEGGKAVANWPGTDFRAAIVTGWGCRTRDSYFNGSKIPPSVPVFNVVTRRDDWLFLNNGGNCAEVWKNHPIKQVLYPEGNEHWVNDKYWPQIEAFIRSNTG